MRDPIKVGDILYNKRHRSYYKIINLRNNITDTYLSEIIASNKGSNWVKHGMWYIFHDELKDYEIIHIDIKDNINQLIDIINI